MFGVGENAGAVAPVGYAAGRKPAIVQGLAAVRVQLPGLRPDLPHPLHALDQRRQFLIQPGAVVRQLVVARRGPLDHALVHQPHQRALFGRSAKETRPVFYRGRVRRRNSLPVKIRLQVPFGQIEKSAARQVVGHSIRGHVMPDTVVDDRSGLEHRIAIQIAIGTDHRPRQERAEKVIQKRVGHGDGCAFRLQLAPIRDRLFVRLLKAKLLDVGQPGR